MIEQSFASATVPSFVFFSMNGQYFFVVVMTFCACRCYDGEQVNAHYLKPPPSVVSIHIVLIT